MNTLFKKEFKTNYKSLLVWTISATLLSLASFWEYGATMGTTSYDELFAAFPNVVNVLFGVSELGMGDIMGYFALILYYIVFIGVAYAFVMGNNILQKEIDDKTSEFLFTKPITRKNILTNKFAVVALDLGLFNIITSIITTIVMVNLGDDVYSKKDIITFVGLSFIGLYLLMLLVFQFTLAMNIVFKNKKIGSAISELFILYMYAMSIAVQAVDGLENYEILTPWRYFNTDLIVKNNSMNILYCLIVVALIVLLNIWGSKKIMTKTF